MSAISAYIFFITGSLSCRCIIPFRKQHSIRTFTTFPDRGFVVFWTTYTVTNNVHPDTWGEGVLPHPHHISQSPYDVRYYLTNSMWRQLVFVISSWRQMTQGWRCTMQCLVYLFDVMYDIANTKDGVNVTWDIVTTLEDVLQLISIIMYRCCCLESCKFS